MREYHCLDCRKRYYRKGKARSIACKYCGEMLPAKKREKPASERFFERCLEQQDQVKRAITSFTQDLNEPIFVVDTFTFIGGAFVLIVIGLGVFYLFGLFSVFR